MKEQCAIECIICGRSLLKENVSGCMVCLFDWLFCDKCLKQVKYVKEEI